MVKNMKKLLKILVFSLLGLMTVFVIIILLSQYVFTRKINLSCRGQWTVEQTINNKLTTYKESGLEGVIISLTEYPFSDPFIQINHDTNLLLSEKSTKDNRYVFLVNHETISGGHRYNHDESKFSFYGVQFNRLTKTIQIDKIISDEKLGFKESKVFNGVCEVVKPL
jgi:hypothetical protein